MKLKEKINKKIDNNKGLSLMKSLWDNKRHRSLFWLILYFIFFFLVIIGTRSYYKDIETDYEPTEPTYPLNVYENLDKLENYSYEIILNETDSLIVGEVEDNTNTFVYKNKNYIIVGDNTYLENKSTLTKVDLTKNSDLIIPINNITIHEIKKYIKDLTPVKLEEAIKYEVSLSNIFEEETLNFHIIFYGDKEVTEIKLDFNDYIELKELEYEEYVLTIKIGDVANDYNN